MNATLYTANGGTPQSITNGVSGQSFAPDFVWVKTRSVSNYHGLADSVRGVNKALFSNTNDAESTASSNYVTSFDTNGFSINQGGVFNGSSGTTMVAWNWKAGGTAVTNTVGTISAQVSANTTSGFSILTYSGNSTDFQTVGHGLGVTPQMVIVKARNATNYWPVWHTSLPSFTYNLYLNTTDNQQTDGQFTSTSSTTVGIRNGGSTNQTGTNYVMYCWAPIAGYSAFGSYTGNGSTDGPFVYLGFRPRFVMIKRTNSTADWMMIDTARSPFNVEKALLQANLSNAEDASTELIDGLSNGFKLRNGAYSSLNASGSTYIYMAFCENPFKYSNAR
jgi:hypothetical protein